MTIGSAAGGGLAPRTCSSHVAEDVLQPAVLDQPGEVLAHDLEDLVPADVRDRHEAGEQLGGQVGQQLDPLAGSVFPAQLRVRRVRLSRYAGVRAALAARPLLAFRLLPASRRRWRGRQLRRGGQGERRRLREAEALREVELDAGGVRITRQRTADAVHPLHEARQHRDRGLRADPAHDRRVGGQLALFRQFPLECRVVGGGQPVAEHRSDRHRGGQADQHDRHQPDVQDRQRLLGDIGGRCQLPAAEPLRGLLEPARPAQERQAGREQQRVQAGPGPPGQVRVLPGPLQRRPDRGDLGPGQSEHIRQPDQEQNQFPAEEQREREQGARLDRQPAGPAHRGPEPEGAPHGDREQQPAAGWAVSA